MISRSVSGYSAVALALSVLGAVANAAAASDVEIAYDKANIERWSCRRCPVEQAAARTAVEIGAHYTTDGEARFGRDNGLFKPGTALLARIRLDQRIGNGELALRGNDLGLDSRHLELSWRGERSRWSASWREITRVNFLDGRTPFSLGAVQTLPVDWVTAFTTSGMSAFDASSREVGSTTKRRVFELDGERQLASRWQWFGRVRFETKRGGLLRGADTLYQTVQLIEPIDQEMRTLSSGLRFTTAKLDAVGWLDRSTFDSDVSGVRFDNPFTSFFTTGAVSSATSTDAERYCLSVRFSPARSTRVAASLKWAEESQDDAIGAPALAGQPFVLGLSVDRFDGRLRFATRLGRKLSLTSGFTFRERDVDEEAAAALSGLSRLFEMKDAETRFQLRYRVSSMIRLDGGVAESTSRRPGQEQVKLDESSVWLKANVSLGSMVLALSHEVGDRDASEFVRITNNHPDTRRFHLTDRERERRRVRLSYTAGVVDLAVYHDAVDTDFADSLLGLREQASRATGIELDWAINEHNRIAAFGSVDELRSLTFGTSDFVNRDWRSDTDDEVTTWGLSFRFSAIGGSPLDAKLDVTSSDGVADYTTTWRGSASPLPRLIADQDSIVLDLSYAITPRSRTFLRVFHERFASADWAIDDVAHDALPTLLGLGLTSPNYRATSFAVGFRRSF